MLASSSTPLLVATTSGPFAIDVSLLSLLNRANPRLFFTSTSSSSSSS
jgi:hypothetical protein